MEALKCSRGHKLCRGDALCFYEQNQGAWHLIVKPEVMEEARGAALFTLSPNTSTKASSYAPNVILCSGCGSKVGAESLVGPEKEGYFCFDAGTLSGLPFTDKKKTWKNIKPMMPDIEIRSCDFGQLTERSPGRLTAALCEAQEADLRAVEFLGLTCSKPRNYQVELFVRAAQENSIVCLATGAGKTLVAVMVVKFLKRLNHGKVSIFLADRIPLVHQQAKVLEEEGGLTVKVITGDDYQLMDKSRINDNFLQHDVVAITAQCFLNILNQNQFTISQCCVIVFDEAHHAQGHHPYSEILQKFGACPRAFQPRLLGLTASPGSDSSCLRAARKISDLCLTYSRCNVITPVMFENEMNDILFEAHTEYSEFKYTAAEITLQQDLWGHFHFLWDQLRHEFCELTAGHIPNDHGKCGTSAFRSMLKKLMLVAIDQQKRRAIKLVDYSLCVLRMIDESDVQGVAAIKKSLSNTIKSGHAELGLSILGSAPDFLTLTQDDKKNGNLSSRVEALLKVVRSVISSNPYSRILVFVLSRDKARRLVSILEKIPDIVGLRPSRIVGHSGFDGMTWEQEQKPMLDRFRSGIVKLLIATSVLEEGLDVPSCNAVVRFDGMTSMIGTVQSRGRARHKRSRFVVLLSEEERKTAWEIRLQEQNMLATVKLYQNSFSDSVKSIVRHLTVKLEATKDSGAAMGNSLSEQADGARKDQADQPSGQSYVIKMKLHGKKWEETLLVATLSDFAQVWACDVELSLVYLRALDGQNSDFSYQNFCREAIPRLLQQDGGTHVWLQKCTTDCCPSLSETLSERYVLNLQSISLGYFKDPNTFFEVGNLDFIVKGDQSANCKDQSSLTVTEGEEELLLSICGRITLEFSFVTIYEWVVCHHDEDCHKQRLYIPLRQAPRAYSSTRGKLQRISAAADHVPVATCMNLMGTCFVYELAFQMTDDNQQKVYAQLTDCLCNHGVLIYDSVITTAADKQNSKIPFHQCTDLSYSTLYLMECLFSQYGLLFPKALVSDKFYEVLNHHSQSRQGHALQAMAGHIGWFCNPMMLLDQALEDVAILEKLDPRLDFSNHLVRHVTVTPLRVIFFEPLAIKGNRMLRQFGPDNFLKVSFRDENMDLFYGTDPELLERVRQLLRSGLLVANRKFMFLGSSCSMLSSHTCWMTCLEPRIVQAWLGDFDTVKPRCVSTYMAGIGMGMEPSDVTITLSKEVVESAICDITVGGRCLSSGVGKISRKCLSKVGHCLQPNDSHFETRICALQVHVAGYKGVLVLDPALPPECNQCVLRKSMFNFCCQHLQLEVLNLAISQPVYLNRQSIVLLSSLGVQDSVFERLQEHELQNLWNIFTEQEAQEEIFLCCQELNLPAVCHAGLSIHTEPFLQLLLAAVYNQKVKVLVERTHILVPDGRLLMGLMDDTFSLNYGEIFVQVCDASTHWERKIVEGPCVAYKNPCFQPGDICKLEARDVPCLRHLVNCVVFPAPGDRPHPFEMAGSGSAGDQYTVIWMPDLIPKGTQTPMLYDMVSFQEVAEVEEVKESDMVEFFVSTISNVQLGRIANSHVVLADSRQAGALDKDCLELAELHATAVEFPKTGLQVCIPDRLIPQTFPDFMENLSRPWYRSAKVIGKMYRRARGLVGDDVLHRRVHVRVKPDTSFLVRGHEKFSNQARQTYIYYCTLMHGLMRCYGIQQEAEIITGFVTRMHDHQSHDIAQLSLIVQQQYYQLLHIFRQQFDEQCGMSVKERYQIASAWYWAAYTDENQERRCLSFPWMLADVLTVIKRNPQFLPTFYNTDPDWTNNLRTTDDAKSDPSLRESISETMFADFWERQPVLLASLLEREDLCEKVERSLKAVNNVSVKIFGSTSTFLFEPAVSDLDLFIHIGGEQQWPGSRLLASKEAQLKLLEEVLPSLQQDFPGTYAIKNTQVPILKYEGTIPFDLTANDNGLWKRIIILNYIIAYPALLLVLTVLVRWARYVGLTARQRKGHLTPFGLVWLFVQFCLECSFISQRRIVDGCTRDRPSNLLSFVIEELMNPAPTTEKSFAGGKLPGEVLLGFFKDLSDIDLEKLPGAMAGSPFSIPDPVTGARSPCVELDADFRVYFVNKCLQAWHALARTRTVKSLFSLGERHVCLRLSRFQSSLFQGAEEYHAQRLSFKSGGKVKVRIFSSSKNLITSKGSRAAPLQLEMQGDPAAVTFIEKHFQELNNGHCWLPWTGRSFFVKGASFLMFEGSLTDEELVGFVPYSGPIHLKHTYCSRHVPVLVAEIGGFDWKSHAFGKLRLSVWRQRQLLLQLSQSDTAMDGILCTGRLRAVLRFGTVYSTNVPLHLQASMDSVSISDLEEYVVRGKRHAEPWRSQTITTTTNQGPSRSEECDLDKCFDLQKHLAALKLSTKLASQKNSKKHETGASLSLFPQVRMSVKQLQDFLREEGFTKGKQGQVSYSVGVYTPKEYRISLNEKLEFVSLSRRHVRWLAGSLVFRADEGSKQTRGKTPNCLRFYIELQNSFETGSDLLTKAKQNAVLVIQGKDQLSVGPAFQGQAAYVRKVRKGVWFNAKGGVTVEILDVEEWEGWDQRTQKFCRENYHHEEVEILVDGADKCLRGSVGDCEKFIQKFWDAAMKFREALRVDE